ncbi:MAG: SDR family oxidoreductase [Thermoanaerobaculia bacterium]
MLPQGTFDGRVALITGGGTGIGFAIASHLAGLGARVLLASRSREHLDPAAERIRAATGRADAAAGYELDVRDPEGVEETIRRAVAEHGGIDILVNNAAGNFVIKAEELSPKGWNAVVGIVLNGTFYCSAAAGRAMIAAGRGGAILNVIANYAWTGAPGVVHSASAKAGVLAMTQTLAVEWARHKIRVNAIAPGPVNTEGAATKLFPDERIAEGIRKTIPLRRFAELEEVANAAAYLLSDYAAYVTGASFVIDGGQWLSGADYWSRLREMSR